MLDGGKQIFYGTLPEARPFMEELGLVCEEGSNVADFLTGVTVSTERKLRAGFEGSAPRDAAAFRQVYEKSPIYQRMISEYGFPETETAIAQTESFKTQVAAEKQKTLKR